MSGRVLLAVVMITGLAACAGTKNSAAGTTTTRAASGTTSTSSAVPTTGVSPTGNAPCTLPALQAALTARQPSNPSVLSAGQFRCNGSWAVAFPVASKLATITILLRASGNTWQIVDRSVYCANHRVPAVLYQSACETN